MSPRVMAQVQLHLLLPERSSGCGTHGCFGACRGLVPGTHMPWMRSGVGPGQRENTKCLPMLRKESSARMLVPQPQLG